MPDSGSPTFWCGLGIALGGAYVLKAAFLWSRMSKDTSVYGHPLRTVTIMLMMTILVWFPFIEEGMSRALVSYQWILTFVLWTMAVVLVFALW